MSYDGTFSCESSVKRLLTRCSGLRSDRKLLALSQKVGAVTAEDIVEAIAEPFLHPKYTIPIVGCFRPLCRLIVDRAVTKLGSVPSLISMSDEESDDIGEDDTRVIDFYMERGRGLRLHEMASLALCRALDLAPFLLRCILNYFRFSPQPFGRLELAGFDSQITDEGEKHLLDVIRLTYRFLIMEPQIFSDLWDWTCFLNLIQQTSDTGAIVAPRRLINILDIRWCGIQILSTSLKISDRATEDFGLDSDEAFACLLRFEEFCQDTSLEKAGFYLPKVDEDQERCSVGIGNFSQLFEFDYNSLVSSTNLLKIESGMKDRRKVLRVVPGKPFVMTSTIRGNFEMTLMAVGQRWPILLHGPAGSGKTAIINTLAEISQNQVLFIHMDDQMDSKMFIGNYVCSNQPGEFRWHPGSLTQAISKGYWVVFEDIDKAPIEVQSIILPLLEGSSIFVTGHGEEIDVSENFRMFATISTLKHEVSHEIEGRLSFSTLWRKVLVKIPNSGDMTEIVNAWYPNLNPLTSRLMDTFIRINSHSSNQVGVLACRSSSGTVSRFSLRDLLKWCKRISNSAISVSGFPISVTDCQAIYHEAVETFVAYLPCSPKKLLMMREIAKVWGVPLPETEHDYPPNKPVIQSCRSHLQVGRVALPFTQIPNSPPSRPFVGIRSSLHALERVASSVKYNEPVLLVGETGTGKTTLVQNLAMRLGQQLTVLNLSQQSDIADLLGGYKPADARSICIPLYQEFKELFCRTFSEKENESLLRHLEIYVVEKKWKKLLCACQRYVDFVIKLDPSTCGSKRKRPLTEVLHEWGTFSSRVNAAQKQIGTSSGVYFKFVEGAFITALRNGYWILLDEINLAPPETLQRITGVLDSEKGTLCLAERGDIDYIDRHPSFRLFACMNPATDAGKRELSYSLRSRFTEYFVDDILDENDLTLFIRRYMDEMDPDSGFSNRIVHFYKAAKRESEERLQDGANQKPQFSLRSLARALEYIRTAGKTFGIQKALYDGFCMFFLTMLDRPSAKIMHSMIVSYILGGSLPKDVPFDAYFSSRLNVHDVSGSVGFLDDYVLTRSVKENLKNIARAVFIKKFPVLLQGPTSSGKTSLVHYLASVTGHEFVRINNHEHTDLQEYFGTYITDSQGRLLFQEGVLVKAVRLGYWIVLDELNLAPSDVLEALNRLLDDNRELFIPELQETIHAHPNFMLFATQNPPTLYGGRKMLSRAFRNRFLEIHVDEIPEDELSMILELRCKIPSSYASKMVEVMKELQLHRQHSKIFAGKHGFITPRDLFRWANRFRMFGMSYEDLAKDGYFLLAERLRDENEKVVVKEALERHLRAKINVDNLYMEANQDQSSLKSFEQNCSKQNFENITWTNSLKRLFFLVERCYRLREPVLLIGETGGGKTTVCQLLSVYLKEKLHILNCHQYTETSDFIGGFYPVRDRSKMSNRFIQLIEQIKASRFFNFFSREELSTDITKASSTMNILNELLNTYKQNISLHTVISEQDHEVFQQLTSDLIHLHQKWQTIFLWQDGPLVQAMKNGDLFLVDEISLADDSVLERLNSVLEPERKLSLAEKGGAILELITAHPNFFLLATMNPGGDYGKKELSPALRNRFTEIWVPPVSDMNEFRSIAQERFINPDLSPFANHMLNFWEWFNMLQIGRSLTLRDLLSWVSFVNVVGRDLGSICAFLHGSFLVLLDGLSLGTCISKHDSKKVREHALSFLVEELKACNRTLFPLQWTKLESYGWGDDAMTCNMIVTEEQFGIRPFCISKGKYGCKDEGFEFLAPTTSRNVLRVLRAMQLSKPVLLEGSPGVGKTSLVVALAEYSGHSVVRINLSEQTDMMDLLGSDLPTQKDNGMEFSWSDGILLKALKDGSWVLLDELNLAPQSVLEGLNAILDHRAEVFIPELGLTFKCPPSFRIFACQNPSHQGGGRKSLPRSFLNRFTKVYVDELDANDYLFICRSQYPSIPETVLSNLICFNKRLFEDTMIHRKYGQEGSPWEFNLRDVIRSCQIIEGNQNKVYMDSFLNIVYLPRMRTVADRCEVLKLYEEVFELKPSVSQLPKVHVNPDYLVIGSACAKRNYFQPSKLLKSQLNILPGLLHSLEVGLHCVQQRWLCILVGPYSSGKTSLVRLLAHLTGNTLHELNLSPGTDVTDLLGSFEQYNSFRNYKDVITQVEHYIGEYFSLKLEEDWKDLINQRKDLISKWFSFLASRNKKYSLSASLVPPTPKQGYCDCLHLFIEIIELLQHVKDKLPVSWSKDDLEILLTIASGIKKNMSLNSSANFEWVSGHLIKAIQNGDWVILENANLCNPTVLDRINSLFEPNGSIIINECGLLDGKPMVLQAHPNFRMFITVDPKHGEVSRAMRNRGVEIFMMNQIWLPTVHLEIDREDVKRFLILSGIPCNKLVSAMTEAHMSLTKEGSRLGVRITLRELSRWVQLFQQLLLMGNQPKWSLQLSWEHTYLSSFGEDEGVDAVMKAKFSYLSDTNWYVPNEMLGPSLHLPKGWPSPLTLRYSKWYSRETSTRESCLFLEFLLFQSASCEFQTHEVVTAIESRKIHPSIIPVNMLHQFLFPDSAYETNVGAQISIYQFDLALINNMLFFAANWSIEQAMESDTSSYVLLFKWYGSQVQQCCQYFNYILNILQSEINHSIWKCICEYWKDVISYCKIDVGLRPLPLISREAVNLASHEMLKDCQKSPCSAADCVRLLSLTYRQWNIESDSLRQCESLQYPVLPVLNTLGRLEKKALEQIFKSHEVQQIYTELIEYHMLFWQNIFSSNHDLLSITWSFLRREIEKLKPHFPECVDAVVVEMNNMPIWDFDIEKHALWLYGGHPFFPASSDVYDKMQQLFTFCDDVWQKARLTNEGFDDDKLMINFIISTDLDLKQLALKALCMSSYLATKGVQDDIDILSKIDELYQGLTGRFEHKKRNLELALSSARTIASFECSIASCCTFCLQDLCQQSDFEEWLVTVSLFDVMSFLFDLELLSKVSKCLLADTSELHEGLLNLSDSLVHSVEYALSFSSRSPMDFTSHQTILWILDAWETFDSVNVELSMIVIDMWFKFHSFLWSLCSKTNPMTKIDFEESCLVLPSRTVIIDKILKSNFSIVDYDIQCLKLRTTSRNLWQATLSQGEIVWFLCSAADSLFKQIIFVHYKYFTEDVFCKIKSILRSAFGNSTLEDILNLKSLISSSNHAGLCSVMELLVEPILRELYLKHPPSDYLYNLGCAWLHIGMLRFYLLNQDGPDPALEFSFKHSNMLQKISLFDLETKVRQECQLLSGKGLVIYNEDQRLLTSQKLKAEEKQLRAKVVFRPSCSEYSHLRSECFDYGKLCSSLIEDLKNMGNVPSMVLCNWQATSSKFINHLSEKYANYADLVQPVQVAVYEMKLGVSLVSSSALQKDYLEKVGGVDIQNIKAEVYSFMQFPRSLLYDSIPVNLKNYEQDSMDEFVFASATKNFWSIELMKKLINYSSETNLEKKVSPALLDNVLHYVMLIQTADHVLYSHILDKDCFLVLNCTFDRFAKQWMDMKTQLKAKEDDDQIFKFRTRLIKIEDIMEEEELSDNAMDFDERLLSGTSKNEQMIPVEEDKQIEEEWELIHETFSKSLVRVHSLLYGSTDVVENPSARFIARDDRLISFFQSYKLGTRIIKGIEALTPVSDDQLMPEYLFRVCLEYEETFGIAHKPPRAYNIYKDSNSIVLHKMIKPLGTIQERVELFLVEWPDHPGLQSLGNIIEKLLSAPLSTPVPKALLGLQILVHKAKFLQENASMFSFKDLLDPIYSLISSWQKLELDSWKTLLDDVEEQFEINAAKLWFPLYAVLHRGTSDDAEADKLFTIESIEEFVKSSNVGEFKKRLDLLFSFQGQLNHGVVLNAYSSPTMRENINVLYNAFGYYVQFLHIVVDYIETERKSIEKDLREQLKLFSWERSHDSSLESFSRMRQKIRKLVQKYNEVLQQPLMLVVHQEAISKREKIPAWLENWTSDETNVDVLQCPLSVVKINNAKRFFWFTSWMDKANMLTKNDILCAQGLSDVKHTLTSATSFNELEKSWEESWFSIENISRKAAQFAHIWRHGTKNLTKRRMLGNLLKVLEKSGLSRHRHISNELWISMYSHPSYNVLHLHLLGDLHKSSRDITTSNQIQSDNQGDDIFGFKWKSTNITSQDNKGDDIIGSKWKFANQLYFKNLSVMNQLQEVCLNFSKDFSKEQVDQTNSFLCQLVFIQQEQRHVMYSVYEQLKKLQLKLQWTNGGEQSEGLTIAMNQSALLVLMWKQKNVFDNLLAMSRETNMLLESFKSCHLDTCKVIKDEVDRIYSVIDMFLPRFSKSKESLDMYLVCNDTIVSAANELPFLVTKKMEDLVISNSEIINAFEESILVFSFDKAFPRSIGGTLLSRFEEIINKGKLKVLMSQIDKNRQFATRENSKNLETFYTESYERTIKLLLDVYEKLYTNSVNNIPVLDLSGQITLWNQLFHSYEKVLRLVEIDDALGETISAARKFVDSTSDRKDEVCSQMQIQLKHLYVLLDLILTFGDGILSEYLDVHAAVAELTNVLAHIFILIFSKGFGSSQEEAENSKCNGTEDASGTGMGEGEGVNDVSDQIEDESQLLGTSEKHDGHDELEKQPNSNDKGIEMEEDFDGETFSVSEDSEDDDDDVEDDEDLNLDSQMGQTAEGDQIVDEKLWDGDEEDNTENRSEKYEPGPAVNEKDSGSRELTAKDDNALAADDSEDIDKNQGDRLNEEDNDSKTNEDFNSDDMFVDKSQAFEDPTDIQIEEEAKQTEDADVNEPQGSDMDGSELGSFGSDEEMNDVDDKSKEDNAVDEDVSQVDNNSRIEVEDKAEIANMEPESNKETLPSDAMETFEYPLDGKESIKSSGNSHKIESIVSDMLEADNNDINSSIAPSRSLLSDEMSKIEIASNSVDNSKISYDQSQLKPENSQDSCSRTRPNPYRSLGDALEDWKERAKVTVDPLENLPELVENLANEDAEEYEFVADAEKSTSQALAAATADQINNNVDNSKSSADENHRRKNEDTNQNRVKENSDTSYLNPRQDLVSKKKDDELPFMDIGTDSPMEEMGQINNLNNQYESMVSFKSSYMDEKESLLNTGTDDKAFSDSLGIEDMSEGALQETVLEWKRYEVSTTRLSQELAEQLRLVMEPTLASKLQGDYKTGKRINMKKVIPYIASHFRKDKIWLRRTKPNKRNYQVVVAVDDSRSMSESNCGNAAIEALITVCRAMSQLEVGQFAVASFGRKGNVRLLHDFDEPFTGEAGVKIMSNLSFKQDNAIVDEPLVDLLKYLNNMLDNAVSRARMPSGQNPLNQLVLIIADGRIHEKENLKRHVRDALNKKRLIALILLDSPEESIIDLMEASYEGDRLSFKKYLNTFPFPYYIILRNIEALPRTLADLLRQWFELMRNAME